MQYEIVRKTLGTISKRPKKMSAVVIEMIGIHENKNAAEMMQKTLATLASWEMRLGSLICFIADTNFFLNAKLCRTCLKIRI